MQFLGGAIYLPLSSQVPQTVTDEEPYPRAEAQPRHNQRLILSCLATACLFSWLLGIWTARVWVTDRDCLRHSSANCKSNTPSTGDTESNVPPADHFSPHSRVREHRYFDCQIQRVSLW